MTPFRTGETAAQQIANSGGQKTKLKMNKIIKWDDILKRNNGLILNDNESRSTEI